MAYLLAEKCERTWKILDFARSNHSLPSEVPVGGSQADGENGDGAGVGRHAVVAQTPEEVLTQNVSDLIDTAGPQMKGKYSFTKDTLNMVVPFGPAVFMKALDKFPLWGCTNELLAELMRVIWITPGRYFYYGKATSVSRSVKNITKDHCPEYTVFFLLFAAKVFEALGFGKVAPGD